MKKVEIFTDGACSGNPGPGGWAKKWRSQGWMRNKKEPALNPELWEKLLVLCDKHQVNVNWVKGHAGHPENERCDRLAVAQAKRFS